MENQNQVQVFAQPNKVDASKTMVYEAYGKKVELTRSLVQQMFGSKCQVSPTNEELVNFMFLCQYNELNPFLGDAYIVKYGGQEPKAQMITSAQAYMKRAEAHPMFDGFVSGLIVVRNGEMVDVEGSVLLPNDQLIGGFCKVYRKDRKYPYVSRVSLAEYDKNHGTWNTMKSTMIRKCAKVQALREAFPNTISGMQVENSEDIMAVVEAEAQVIDDEPKAAIAQPAAAPQQAVEEEDPFAE